MKEVLTIWWGFAVRALLALVMVALLYFAQGFLRETLTELIALPFVITLLILYGIFDSLIILVMSASLRTAGKLRRLLLLQGGCGIFISTLLAFFFFEKADLFWFVAIALLQLAAMGVLELFAMLHLHRHVGEALMLSVSGVSSILIAMALPWLYSENSYLLASWLQGYGLVLFVSLSVTAFSLRRASHRVHTLAQAA